ALMELTNHRDVDLVQHLSPGFPITGTVSSGGLLPPLKKPRRARLSPEDLVADQSHLEKVQNYLCETGDEERLLAAVEEDILSETESGRSVSHYHINGTPDFIKFVSPLFGVDQGDKATSTLHKVQMPRPARVACLMSELQSPTGPMQLARIDRQAAFRQLPILCKDAERAAGMVCPFGAIGSISAYLRISEFHCHLKNKSASSPPWNYSTSLMTSPVRGLSTMPIMPAGENDLLGLRVNLVNGVCEVSLTPTRKDRLIQDLKMAMNKQTIIDSKFSGRLNFACEAFFGRLGRAPARLITRKSLGLSIDQTLINHAPTLLLQLFTSANYKRNLLWGTTTIRHAQTAGILEAGEEPASSQFAGARSSGQCTRVLQVLGWEQTGSALYRQHDLRVPHIQRLQQLHLARSGSLRFLVEALGVEHIPRFCGACTLGLEPRRSTFKRATVPTPFGGVHSSIGQVPFLVDIEARIRQSQSTGM
ncbi:hypothetical protein FOL47_002745, partial [Perkinsus chesapeaki]